MEKNLKITEYDQHLFGQGTHYDIYKKLGAHKTTRRRKQGVYFAVWAPNARSVSLVGSFNNWEDGAHVMNRIEPLGIYEIFMENIENYSAYKYCIHTQDGRVIYKADPYASMGEKRPNNASLVYLDDDFKWGDNKWMAARSEKDLKTEPMSIYEVHIGSWMRHPYSPENEEGFYTYRECADRLVAYVKEMGYNFIELMGIAEHPFDGSWGYQVTGYYAPTSRYGTPNDFRYLVNLCHKNKIGVILDWVPAHFPKDEHGLAEFDGTCLYEHQDPRQGEHPEWGTKIFNYQRPQVSNFLIANALSWVEEFHIDGLRVDAVASMLYLDYGKKDGEWVANEYGENKNLAAIEFFRHLNSIMEQRNKGAVMIAEESTAWPKVTAPAEEGGLGFTFKWNMGWMNDFLEYMKLDPYFRKYNHNKMTFAMSYNHSERYILVLSHDEVVHLKCSMIEKMPGYMVDKFKNLKAAYSFMIGHPGKKLLFMGQEFGQFREWSEQRELDWFLLGEDLNKDLQAYMKKLLAIYKKYPALYASDYDMDGFEWINADDGYRSIYSFVRKSPTKRNNLLFICNFTPVAYDDYRVGLPKKKKYKLILDSSKEKFGEELSNEEATYMAEESPCDNREYSFAYPLAAYGVAVFVY